MNAYKYDWQEARQRMTDWWEGNKVDRALAAVTASVSPSHPARYTYISDVPAKYTDYETISNNLEYGLEHTFLGGEAFPWHFVYLGPMFQLACLGCEPNFSPKTTWFEPCYKSLDDLMEFEFDRNNYWWQLVKEITRRSVLKANGRYLTSIPIGNVIAIIDVIAGLIGNEKTLIAMTEEPDKLKSVRDKFAILGKETFDELYDITNGDCNGVIDWMGVWSHKKLCTTQCDLSVMISPHMFREFVLEDLESSYSFVNYGIYHLDGEEQIRHLDILLAIEKLKLIQWVPSARVGNPTYGDPLNWIDLFKKIQNAGKSVLIYCPPERVRALLNKISRDKVFLVINCPDEKSAKQTLIELEQIGI